MGSKKRSADAVEEEGVETMVEVDDGDNKEADKTIRKKKMDMLSRMEGVKRRKEMAKEKRRVALENKELERKKTGVESRISENRTHVAVASLSSGGSGMPKFHIGVFNELASADVAVREAGVFRLVTELQEVQKAYERVGDKEVIEGGLKLEADKDDGLNDCAPSVRYAVRRLIRGASSSRECARQGFALGLTLLVSKIPSIRVDSLLKLIVDLLEVSSSMKGLEAKDCLLGRLFAYGALAHSGRLTEEWNSDRNTPLVKEFVSIVISLAAKKRYLQEPAVSVIVGLVEKLPTEAVLNHVLEAPGLHEWFEGSIDVHPDALLLALKIREKISLDSPKFGKILPYPFNPSRLFASDHLSSLVNCLKESAYCQPRLHSVWSVLINNLLPDVVPQAEDVVSASNSLKKHKKNRKSGSSDEEVAKSVQNFCEIVIDGALLLSSHDRKHLAFDILLLLLPRLPASFVPMVLSDKLVQCLVDILSTKDSWLHKVGQHFVKELSAWIGNDDVRRVAVIVALQKHSNGKFDPITRTKTVKSLMGDFQTESGCMLFIQNVTNLFVDEGHASEEPSDQSQTTDDNSEIGSVEDKDSNGAIGSSDSLKIWVVESLPGILKCLNLDPEAKFRVQKELLKFLAVQGLFSASLGSEVTSFELQEKFRWPKAATSISICRMCIEQIQHLLAHAEKIEVSHSLPNGRELNDLGFYFMRFLSTLRNIPSVSLFRSLSDEDEKAFQKLQKMETRLSIEERNTGQSADSNKLHSLRYLLIQLLLQIFLRPGELSEAASELVICCKKAFASSDLLGSSGEDELDGDANPQLMDVLVDTLLSLLPESSVPMRSAIEQVFKCFCDDVTNDGLLRMLRVVKKDLKPARHQEADSKDLDDEEDEDFLGVEEDEEIDDAGTGETGESEEHTDDSETELEVEEADKEQPEGSDDTDGGMDDDAMFRMDTYLAQIFKERKNQPGSETAQYQLVLFKLRVLSLLEIYLHENPGKPQILTVYSSLVQAFINPRTAESSEQLLQRIWGILQKKIFKAKDFPRGKAVELSTLESLLEKNLKLASKPFKSKKSANNLSKKQQSSSWKRHKMIASLAQNSTFWILKMIDARNFTEPELLRVFDVLKDALVGYFDTKKSQIKSGFLKEIFRRRPWIGEHLLGFLLEKCSSARLEFRRVEALALVMEILKSMTASNSDEGRKVSKKNLKNHLQKLSHLVQELVTTMPEKQSRRAEVRKFCSKVFQIVSTNDLAKSFLKDLAPEAHSACESKLGELFLNLKKAEGQQ